jgi:hypothetical protein
VLISITAIAQDMIASAGLPDSTVHHARRLNKEVVDHIHAARKLQADLHNVLTRNQVHRQSIIERYVYLFIDTWLHPSWLYRYHEQKMLFHRAGPSAIQAWAACDSDGLGSSTITHLAVPLGERCLSPSASVFLTLHVPFSFSS